MIKNIWFAIKTVVCNVEHKVFGWKKHESRFQKLLKDGNYDVVHGVWED